MRLQISFDTPDLQYALDIAKQVAPHCDILEVGTLLIYKNGIHAVQEFKKHFPDKLILADAKIVDRAKDAITLLADAGADWITVMSGTGKQVIHTACTTAANLGKKVMLDLLDASSVGQSALEAKNLGVDGLLFHEPYDVQQSLVFLDKWEMIRGNTDLPIFISANITRKTLEEIILLKPAGIIIGSSITDTPNPGEEALYFKEITEKNP
jgi:3-keto-L-gulonate-6-phosphate decarboxylase